MKSEFYNWQDILTGHNAEITIVIGARSNSKLSRQLEEIVRCRDCVHYQPGYCKHFECMEHQISVVEDDYCSFGVRRNERS